MSFTFFLPDTLPTLLALSSSPSKLGLTIGKLLNHMAPLVSTHLDNAKDFASAVPRALADMFGFVASVEDYVAHLRLTDGCSKKSPVAPNPNTSDRKVKASQRKYVDRFTYLTEAVITSYIAEYLGGVFSKWTKEQTMMFNKGVGKAVSGMQWVVYPAKNVVFEAGEGDWAVWLRNECEVLRMEEVRVGRRMLKGM